MELQRVLSCPYPSMRNSCNSTHQYLDVCSPNNSKVQCHNRSVAWNGESQHIKLYHFRIQITGTMQQLTLAETFGRSPILTTLTKWEYQQIDTSNPPDGVIDNTGGSAQTTTTTDTRTIFQAWTLMTTPGVCTSATTIPQPIRPTAAASWKLIQATRGRIPLDVVDWFCSGLQTQNYVDCVGIRNSGVGC